MAKNKGKTPKAEHPPTTSRTPKTPPKPDEGRARFSFARYDTGYPSAATTRAGEEPFRDIAIRLREFEGMTWGQLKRAQQGKLFHDEELCDLYQASRDRLVALRADDVERLWRFRLGSRQRLWGFFEAGVFEILWWDPEHEVRPIHSGH